MINSINSFRFIRESPFTLTIILNLFQLTMLYTVSFFYVGRNRLFFLLGYSTGKKERIFPSWLDALNCAILYALPPPYRHGKEVCQGC